MSGIHEGEHILTKTLRDGATEVELRIEPQTDEQDHLGYWYVIYWDGQRGPALNAAKKGGTFQSSPHRIENPPAPGITHAIRVKDQTGFKWVTLGLTGAEAAQIEKVTSEWLRVRKDRIAAGRAAAEARVRDAAPGAPTFEISGPYGVPAVGETARDGRGRAVTSLRTWRRYIAEDGMSLGVMDDSGWLYCAEVREATEAERAELEEREAEQARRETLRARGAELWRSAGGEVPEKGATGELKDLPGVRVEPERHTTAFGSDRCYQHLRVDEAGGWLWVLIYNAADGDDWSVSNYRAYIARRIPLTPELAALTADLRAEFGTVDA